MSSSEKLSKAQVPTLLELTARSQYNNREVVKYYNSMTMHKALNSSSSSIGLIAKNNKDEATRCICNLFKATAMYFDTPLSQSKAELIAVEILSKYEYRNLKLEDLLAICIRIKESDSFKLTIAKILSEVRKYTKEREKLAIERSIRGAESNKLSLNAGIEERLKKHFKSLPNADRLASKRESINQKFK